MSRIHLRPVSQLLEEASLIFPASRAQSLGVVEDRYNEFNYWRCTPTVID